jgi:ubiquinone/menaquinone biosynthesis C-methylase UbiE
VALLVSYLREPEAVLAECYRVLKPGGILVMSNLVPEARLGRLFFKSIPDILRRPFVFLPMSLKLLAYGRRFKLYARSGRFRFFTEGETLQLVTDAGFSPSRISISRSFADQAILAKAVK